jgi:hypothetical protein
MDVIPNRAESPVRNPLFAGTTTNPSLYGIICGYESRGPVHTSRCVK